MLIEQPSKRSVTPDHPKRREPHRLTRVRFTTAIGIRNLEALVAWAGVEPAVASVPAVPWEPEACSALWARLSCG